VGRQWRRLFSNTTSLRGAAATIFALTAILPLSTLVALLWRSGHLGDPHAQINVLLALVVALLGFVLLQYLIRGISSVASAVHAGGDHAALAGNQQAVVPAVGRVGEIAEITEAFSRLLGELRQSTDKLGDSVEKLGALNEVAELAARIPALSDLLEVVLERTMRTVRASIGSIMLIDAERRTLRVVASRGLADVEGIEVALGEGIAGKVAQLGDAVVVEDIETDTRFSRPNDPKYGGGSFICVPLRARDRVIGVLNLARKQAGIDAGGAPGAFSATDLHFLNALMTNVGYAVDNARMLDETRRTARELQQALDDARAAQARLVEGETLRALGELTSGMAHHLNNLLAVVVGRVDLLLAAPGDGVPRSRLEIIRGAALDAADVVRRVLRFSDRHAPAAFAPVDLNELACEVVELQRPRWYDEAQLRGVTIDVVVEVQPIPPVTGDSAALREVLASVLVNAIEAVAHSGGRIVVATAAEPGGVTCSIRDSGRGMPAALRHRAAEPFFTTKGPQGVGLGLSASYGIVEQHGGELVIDSDEGRGTTVTIRLPVVPAAPVVPEGATPASTPLRILLVDDEPDVRLAVADMLAEDGHAVAAVGAGRAALMRLERGEPYDLVLTDLGMPDMTGWDVARAIKARWPKLPVALITGWQESARSDDERRAVDMTIAKPVTFETLRALVARVVRG